MSDSDSDENVGGRRKFTRQLSNNVHTFFGVNKKTLEQQQHRWRSRSLRLTGRQSSPAAVNSNNALSTAYDNVDFTPLSQVQTPHTPGYHVSRVSYAPSVSYSAAPNENSQVTFQPSPSGRPSNIHRQVSSASTLGRRQERINRKREIALPPKESISNMMMDCFKSLRVPEKKSRKPCHYSRSFKPTNMANYYVDPVFTPHSGDTPGTASQAPFSSMDTRQPHQPAPSQAPPQPATPHTEGLLSAGVYGSTMYDTCDSLFDSVFFDEQITKYVSEPPGPTTAGLATPTVHRGKQSPAPFSSARSHLSPIASESDGMYDTAPSDQAPPPHGDDEDPHHQDPSHGGGDTMDTSATWTNARQMDQRSPAPIPKSTRMGGGDDFDDAPYESIEAKIEMPSPVLSRSESIDAETRILDSPKTPVSNVQDIHFDMLTPLQTHFTSTDQLEGISERISSKWTAEFGGEDNTNRKTTGLGIIGYCLNAEYRSDALKHKSKQLNDVTDKRAYFTWWITFVQTVVYIISVSVYGFAPIGIEETKITGEVIKPNLAIEKVFYFERDNMWIGPRRADLIHMGAKFSPCMRQDKNIQAILDEQIHEERVSGCCVRNDGSGCIQSSKKLCSPYLSTWINNTEENKPAVCGQDPRYCKKPVSNGIYTWKNDITTWPICYDSSATPSGNHMTCTLNARPCCLGILGTCTITTREYCDFRRGYFHEEANLCSQVSCMAEICGMISFLDPNKPAQFYRLWTSLFLHAGLVQLLISIAFQLILMRDIEKLAGWFRIMIIYLVCGVAGSLSSAIFLPYHVEAGPAGSQFGILACSFAELLQNIKLLKFPWCQVAKLSSMLIALFAFGLLPYVDNYAHLIGFMQGLLLSFALLPNVMAGNGNIKRKTILIIGSLVVSSGFFVTLLILFYVVPVYNCPGCQYFNCIPFTARFCQSMEVQIKEVVIRD